MGRTSCFLGAVVGHRAVVSSSPQPLRLVASVRGGSEEYPGKCAGPVETRAGPMGAHTARLGGAVGICRFFVLLSSKRGLYLHLETELGRLIFDIASQEVT